MSGMRVQVESRDDIKDRIGRSPDCASALILARMDTPKLEVIERKQHSSNASTLDYNPLASF